MMKTTSLPSHQYLERVEIPFEKAAFPTDTPKGAAQVAQALGYRPRQMIKTLIFETDRGERILVMVGGDQNIVSGNLKKVVGSRNIQLASSEVVKETTGYEIGSIPPFGWQREGFRSFIDASLMHEPILGVGTGVWGNEILITPINLVKASKAQIVNLVERDKPALQA
jgi:Cys-tRNA(Pro)/Cys-tRNA(Cys) deacylase